MERKWKWSRRGSGKEMEWKWKLKWKWSRSGVDWKWIWFHQPPRRHQLQGSTLSASSTSCSEAVPPSPTLLTPFPLSPPSPRGPQGKEGGTGRVLPAALRRRPAAGSSYSGPRSMVAAALGGGEWGWGTPGKNPGAVAEPSALSPIYKQGPPAVRDECMGFFLEFPPSLPAPQRVSVQPPPPSVPTDVMLKATAMAYPSCGQCGHRGAGVACGVGRVRCAPRHLPRSTPYLHSSSSIIHLG